MVQSIFEEMGGRYERQGEYILPCLTIPPEKEQSIDLFGRRHLDYLREYRKITYTNLLTSGRLNAYLADIDRQAQERFENISEERKGSSILIFKDSYANSFIQFLSYNYEIIDIIDLRYFKESIRNFMKDKDYNEILIMYSFNNLSTDINIRRLKF